MDGFAKSLHLCIHTSNFQTSSTLHNFNIQCGIDLEISPSTVLTLLYSVLKCEGNNFPTQL